ERQRQDDDDGEAFSAAQAAKRELDVACELVDRAAASDVANEFFVELDTAEITQRVRSRCRRAFAARNAVGRLPLDVIAHLVIEIALDLCGSQQRAQAQPKRVSQTIDAHRHTSRRRSTAEIARDRRSQLTVSSCKYFRPGRVSA